MRTPAEAVSGIQSSGICAQPEGTGRAGARARALSGCVEARLAVLLGPLWPALDFIHSFLERID